MCFPVTIGEGIRRTIREIRESEGYDPLVHLDEAKEKGVDLTDFYQNHIECKLKPHIL